MVFTAYTVRQLKNSEQFGYIVIMMIEMWSEVVKFFSSFGLILFGFLVALRFNTYHFKVYHITLYENLVDIIDAFMGTTSIDEFTVPKG